jgi:hypothetical protein
LPITNNATEPNPILSGPLSVPSSSLTDSAGLLFDLPFDGLPVDPWWLNLPGHISSIARAADLASGLLSYLTWPAIDLRPTDLSLEFAVHLESHVSLRLLYNLLGERPNGCHVRWVLTEPLYGLYNLLIWSRYEVIRSDCIVCGIEPELVSLRRMFSGLDVTRILDYDHCAAAAVGNKLLLGD